ncbi:MAG TPA: carbohydrate ABC transporter substrate-binding protein, partial [Halanaerobiales bacterium]|nr:carbohydrate ABC transporter substrate-binding protein [Halanaerobiales bacterium]
MLKDIKFLITFLIAFILLFSFNSISLQARPLLFAPEEKVEIYCAWNDDFNCLAKSKLYELLKNKYPNVEIINAHIACTNKDDINDLLIKRIFEGNPPDIFQVHCSHELINNLVKTGSVSSITNLLNEMDIIKKFNPQILRMYSYEGEVYA